MRAWPTLLALGISAASAGAVLYWGGQDKQGRFQIELLGGVGPVLFFAGPYLVLAAAAAVSWRHRASNVSCLSVTLVCALIGVSAIWSDHVAYLQTPPGREVAPMLGFLATILLWLGSGILFLVTIVRRRQPDAT